jgi:hypothetical protein
MNCDYPAHCRAAREFAAAYLDYRKVLPGMLDACGASAAKSARDEPRPAPRPPRQAESPAHGRTVMSLGKEA